MKNIKVIYLALFLVALIIRVYSLTINHPFWVDEFSTAVQAKIYIKTFPNTFSQILYDIEPNNYLYHSVVAVFFLIFGDAEWVARAPAALSGSLVCVVMYIYAKRFFNHTTALIAFSLICFSYFHLTWSTQARGYTFQQLFLLLSHIFIFNLLQAKKIKTKIIMSTILSVCLLLGLLTHTTFLIVVFSMALYLLVTYKETILKSRKNVVFLTLPILTGLIIWLPQTIHVWKAGLLSLNNNLWYYHSLLWREETLIVFLSVIGILKLVLEKKNTIYLPLITMISYFILYTFIFQPYTSRYVMSYFPFLILFAAYGIYLLGSLFNKYKIIYTFGILSFILINGNTFKIKPQEYYSVNHTMRDIALLDYNQVYSRIVNTINSSAEPIVMIDTWRDRSWWYLGVGYEPLYALKWEKSKNTINGLLASSEYYEKNQVKYMKGTGNPGLKLVLTLKDLELIRSNYSKGFIWIDDTSLSSEVIQYAEQNMKKEISVDHYAYDDNPYSQWPGTLYSWGI